ncbi:MAG: hypothetical protein L6Q84_15850, partial [Polyangiaceae bacterium]|nr:hypothetical protein [Polyangiaceae bacterium]
SRLGSGSGPGITAMTGSGAYTLLSLWRSVTLRSDQERSKPWRVVMRHLELALIKATAAELAGLRRHRLPPAPD